MSRVYAFKCDHCGDIHQSLSSMTVQNDFHFCQKEECQRNASRSRDISLQIQRANSHGPGGLSR
jgi:hypothetical protein